MKKNVPELYERLMLFAINYCRASHELAEESAADAMLACVERDNMSFNYGAACVKNFIADHYRKERVRKNVPLIEVDEETGEHRIKDAVVLPNQSHAMFVSECLKAIEQMSDKIRPVMRYVAQEWTDSEIALVLDLPLSEVQWRRKYGRKLLREMSEYGFDAKRGHNKLIGIRRRHQRWEAAIRSGEQYIYLGHFDSATDAAKAYDKKAKELLGIEAKLNFPSDGICNQSDGRQ